MPQAIEVEGLEKTFVKKRSIRDLLTRPFAPPERVRALRGVDLSVDYGEIFGLLGPNGAGKTTLLKILSCLVLPDAGTARVDGHDVRDDRRVKPRIGLVTSDERSFYWRLDAWENLRFFATLYDVPKADRDARIEELLGRVDLLDAARRPFADYSSGMKQRMAIARALLHDPAIVFMDEPTRSLDPVSSLSVREFTLRELSRKDGKTIVIATHDLREAQLLCSRVAFVMRGRVRAVGAVDEVRRIGLDGGRHRLEVAGLGTTPRGPFEVVSEIREDATPGAATLELAIAADATLGDAMRVLLDAGARILSCEAVEHDLEAAFSRLYRETADDEAERRAVADGGATP